MRTRVALLIAAYSASLFRTANVFADNDEFRQERADAGADAFASMLSLVPAGFSGFSETDQTVMFADIAAQLAVAGVEPPDSLDGDAETVRLWLNATLPLAIASPFGSSARLLDRSLIGFDITDVDQTLEFGTPPFIATLLRGRFDHNAVEEAWTNNGYMALSVDGVAIASLSEDAKLDLTSEVGRIALARMNNAAFLDDGTLVYTSTLSLLTEILETAADETSSLADRVDIATILQTAGDSLASAILFQGSVLSVAAMVSPNLGADPEVLEELLAQLADPVVPPIAFGLMGITPGGPTVIPAAGDAPMLTLPPGSVVFRLLMVAPGSAEAAGVAIDRRLRSMSSSVDQRMYAEIYASWRFELNQDGTVLTIELTPAVGVSLGIWTRMLFQRDLLFLAW